uniref:Calcineurin-like phosphoesterase domain-containing protein n=1 Tax=Romanomermis culicivorax TaxID=13658 RepID=A0A915J4N1_ROMCU
MAKYSISNLKKINKETFVKVFKALARNKPWYIVAGNHDYLGSIDAQIGYHSINPTWYIAKQFYIHVSHVSFRIAGFIPSPDSFTVDFIMLDTIILCGNTLDSKDLISPPGPPNKSAADDQTRWLKERLESSRTLLKHKENNIRLLAKEGMIAIVHNFICGFLMMTCGHRHVTSNVQNHKLNFIVSGTAAYRDSVQLTTHEENTTSQFFYPVKSTNNSPYLRRTSDDKPGFVVGKLTKYRAVFRFYNSDGTLLYNFNAIPRKSQFWSVLLKT